MVASIRGSPFLAPAEVNMKMQFAVLPLVFLMACPNFLGCASIRHANAKDHYITSQMQTFAFNTDCNNVMAGAKQLLFRNGYHVRGFKATNSMETDWAMIDERTQRQYLITTLTNTNGSCSVQFDYVDETHYPTAMPVSQIGRDYVMEYELIKQLEPDTWRKINDDAEAYADAHD